MESPNGIDGQMSFLDLLDTLPALCNNNFQFLDDNESKDTTTEPAVTAN